MGSESCSVANADIENFDLNLPVFMTKQETGRSNYLRLRVYQDEWHLK